MSDRKQYNTRQRQYILECMKSQGSHYVTIQQIADYLAQNGISVGLTTIYRTMDKLAEEGEIARVIIDGMHGTCYRYISRDANDSFFSMKCEQCGRVLNIECPRLNSLYEHLSEEHKIQINPGKTMFYGVCEQCGAGKNVTES